MRKRLEDCGPYQVPKGYEAYSDAGTPSADGSRWVSSQLKRRTGFATRAIRMESSSSTTRNRKRALFHRKFSEGRLALTPNGKHAAVHENALEILRVP